jgi:hypothetical protein
MEDGSWTSDVGEMESMTRDFFKQLFTQEDNIYPSSVIDAMRTCVDADMTEKLCSPFTEKEISDALFQIGPLKAHGPDGFPAHFLQRDWTLLKDEVVKEVQLFFTTGNMPGEVNDTAIVLIPKKNDPEVLKDFHPISM